MKCVIALFSAFLMCLSACGGGGSEKSKQLTQYQINLVGHYVLDSYEEDGVFHDSAEEQGEWGGELFLDDDGSCEYRVFERIDDIDTLLSRILTGSLSVAIWEEGEWAASSISLNVANVSGLYWNESEPLKVGVDYGQVMGLSVVWPNGRERTEYWFKQTPPPRN